MKIILGISGSIAAYKSAVLTRLLVKAGAEVQVLMTKSALDFIAPLLASLPCPKSPSSRMSILIPIGTTTLTWACGPMCLLIAPATANTLAKFANGLCDNILSAVFLSARCPVFVAPAMDVDMWRHPSTQANIQRLEAFGVNIIPVEHGELASGLVGDGRMAEPEHIVRFLFEHLGTKTQPLTGKKALVTAGPKKLVAFDKETAKLQGLEGNAADSGLLDDAKAATCSTNCTHSSRRRSNSATKWRSSTASG